MLLQVTLGYSCGIVLESPNMVAFSGNSSSCPVTSYSQFEMIVIERELTLSGSARFCARLRRASACARAGRGRPAVVPAPAPGGLAGCGPLRAHLALILPELGEPAAGERPRDAVRGGALRVRARRRASATRWSCSTTCSGPTRRRWSCWRRSRRRSHELPVLVVAAYRSDGLPRDHGAAAAAQRAAPRRPARRADARAARRSRKPPSCWRRALGSPPSPALAGAIHDRTRACRSSSRSSPRALASGSLTPAARAGARGDDEVPLPDTVRDAVLIGASELSGDARAAAEVAAVAGEAFDLELVGRLADRRRARGAGRARDAARGRAGAGAVPPRAHARGDLRGRPVAAPARPAPPARRGAGARAARRAASSRRTGSARATTPARARRCCARPRRPRPCTPTATPPRRTAQALELWPERRGRRAGASRRSSATRAAPARRRPRRGRARLARGGRGPRGPRARRRDGGRAAPARGDPRAARRPRVGVRRAAGRGRGLRGERRPGRGGGGAARDGEPPAPGAPGTAPRSSSRARRARRRTPAGRLDLRIRALGLEGLATAKHGEYGEGLEIVRGGLALALEHDLHARSRPSSTSGSASCSTTLPTTGARRMRSTTALDLCRAERRRRHGARVRDLHGLRAARARRLERAPRR